MSKLPLGESQSARTGLLQGMPVGSYLRDLKAKSLGSGFNFVQKVSQADCPVLVYRARFSGHKLAFTRPPPGRAVTEPLSG